MHKSSYSVGLAILLMVSFGCNSSRDKTRSGAANGASVADKERASDQQVTNSSVEKTRESSEVIGPGGDGRANPNGSALPASKLGWDGTTFVGTVTMGLVPME